MKRLRACCLALSLLHQVIYCQENSFHFLDVLPYSNDLTEEELLQLSYFMKFLFYESHFGYVLLSAKPLALETIPNHEKITEQWCKSTSSFNQIIKLFNVDKGRKVFLKLNIPIGPDIIYFEEKRECNTDIFLCNRKSLQTVFENNIEVFRFYFQKDASPGQITDAYLYNPKIREDVNRNPYLLGILLGYGEKNAKLYDSIRQIKKNRFLSPNVKLQKIKHLDCDFCAEHESMFYPYMPPLPLPGFAGNPNDQETVGIIVDFKKSRKQIFTQMQHHLTATIKTKKENPK